MSIFRSIRQSTQALKQTATLTGTALLTAIYVVLHAATTIVINAVVQIRFSPVALAVAGAMYGPVAAGLAGAVGDILKCLVRPTGAFFFGFTLGEFVRGFIYGLFLYQKKPTALRVLAATVTSAIVVDFFLTALWLTMMGNGALIALLIARGLKVIVMCGIEYGLVYGFLKVAQRARVLKTQNVG